LTLTIIHAQERDTPDGWEGIDWKLIIDFQISSKEEAIEKLSWYALRWKIEVFQPGWAVIWHGLMIFHRETGDVEGIGSPNRHRNWLRLGGRTVVGN
jgi:hypothetical protein